uniref:Major facilitator superfamily (MFS) profile domain-containing protein n=1 Tax=Monodelphis domestica TaxID=13616 RepID=F6UAV4_MONDO
MGFSDLLRTFGGIGHFQVLLIALMVIPGILYACNNFLQNFIAVVPEHHCLLWNQTIAESPFLGDGRDKDLLRAYIPMDKAGKPEKCLRFTEPQWQLLNANFTEEARPATEDCLDGWVYDKSVFLSSIVTEWDLVCGQKALQSIPQTMYLAGQLLGSLVFGMLSDRFGRRKILMCTSLMIIITSTCVAFVPTFTAFVILRFFIGSVLMGANMAKNCLTLEWMPIERRVLAHACNTYAYSLGTVLLSAWAYLIREWRWLQFSTSRFPFSPCSIRALPESARWLITHNKLHMAVKSLQKVAWINGQQEEGRKLTPEVWLREILPTWMCKITLCVISTWFTCGFTFYGLAFNLESYDFSLYVVQVLFGLIDIPARLLAFISISYLGHRFTLMLWAVFSGSTIIIGIFVPQDLAVLRMTLAVLGKGSMVAVLSCLFLYIVELFPTEIRQMGMSVGNTAIITGTLSSSISYITGHYIPILPSMASGMVPILSAIAASFLIETNGLQLLETIQEMENSLRWFKYKEHRKHVLD